jgi:hypothetical protein
LKSRLELELAEARRLAAAETEGYLSALIQGASNDAAERERGERLKLMGQVQLAQQAAREDKAVAEQVEG